ncbi:MAG: ABC transporter permease [Roseburia sp.]
MIFENIKEAITSIFSNKMRSILTMLGIIIGISSVITITTIGNSIKDTLNSTLNSLGGNTIAGYVDARYPENDEDWDTWVYPEMDEDDYITQEMLDALIEAYPDEFTGVAAQNYLGTGQVKKSSKEYANVEIQGATAEYLDYMKLDMYAGRSITAKDCEKKKNVCVVSNIMAEHYFGTENPIGEQISVDMSDGTAHEFTIVGVYVYNEALFGRIDTSIPEKDRTTAMMIPYQTTYKLQGSSQIGYDYFNLLVNPTADIMQATEDATEFLNQYYEKNEDWNVYAYNMQSDMGMIDTVINVITVAISGIAAISLIVGGVGVMNIMLVSITERTREIGVRMALGAKRKTIRMQFVIEAIVLCLIGGMIGIAIGMLNGFLLGKVAGFIISSMYAEYSSYIIMSVHPSVTAILLSLFFSMLTGVFFGFYPANKASKMEVIDALRYE